MGPVRLESEILQQALVQAGESSPRHAADVNLSNRELDDVSLLAVETPMVENLNLAFNHLRRVNPIQKLSYLEKLNLSHNELLDVERLGSLKSLRVLNLSKNKLAAVGSIAEMQELEELWLRDNQVSELGALQGLGQCASLKRLVLKPNPICKKCPELYFHFLVHNIASLEMLDGRPVGAEERDAAAAFLLSPEGRKQLREAGLSSRCNARAAHPTNQHVEEGEEGLEVGKRRPVPPKKGSKSARSSDRRGAQEADADQAHTPNSERNGRPARVPLSHRVAPSGQGGGAERRKGAGEKRREPESSGYTQLYSNGQVAVVARRNGASEARYFNGSIAVSLDSGRLTAMYRNGDVAVTSDESGNAMVCLPSGLNIYNHSAASGGRLCDMVTGTLLQEWDAAGRPTGPTAPKSSGPKALLQCRLNEHIGVRIDSPGGRVEVFFVCDASGAKGGGGGVPGSSKKERGGRIKHRFSAARPPGLADWDDSGPFGDGAPPPRERAAVVQPITTEEYIGEIRAATDTIIDFEALKANLGSGGDDISLVFRGKINSSGTAAALATMGPTTTKANQPGAAARRAAYDKSMRGKAKPAAAATLYEGGLKYADPPIFSHTHSHTDIHTEVHSPSLNPYSQLQSYGTPTGSPSKRSPAKTERGERDKREHGSPKGHGGGAVRADDPTELVQQLARNAQDALKRLTHNLESDRQHQMQADAAHKSSPGPSPSKQRRPPRNAAAAPHARSAHQHSSGADKYLSPGGGFNGAVSDSGVKGERRRGGFERPGAGVRRKGGGGGRGAEKLSTGEDVTPDLPAEELQRLEAIRAQMRNMLGALSHGYG